MRTTLFIAAFLQSGCFLWHGPPDGPHDDGGVDGGGGDAATACHPTAGITIVTTEPPCLSCPSGEQGGGELSISPDGRGPYVCTGVSLEHPSMVWPGLCDLGYVATDLTLSDHGCATARSCLYYYEAAAVAKPDGACAYSDMTLARSGELARYANCAELNPLGLCSADCECAAGTLCYGVSETHAVGVCARWSGGTLTQYCEDHSRRCNEPGDEPGDVCVTATTIPPWLSSAWWLAIGPGWPMQGGRCAPPAACAALQARYPGVWECRDLSHL